ncbi:hypothetical protein CHU32_09720 [Superficieibacter electus]|uniref:Uncharacterized protein n=1 Tax=Superficieibacter electus TaxID=2022662 RepID=A0A2P5GQN2_9ENTR|nr:hypothetical protein [Superficieibacter electus]POP43348.1 hypothetical protein CHU33_15835 [Superficieibacter electus]POP48865.1 hypothetical protein CHU32_09720 [Superficieibacter electus]
MATQEKRLTTEWTQITDGTQDATIQVLGGVIYLRDSPTKPLDTEKGHVIDDWVSVSPPQQAWVRSTWGITNIVVT